MDMVEKTLRFAGDGMNCAQAILAAFGETFGLEAAVSRDLGRPWGGGMGHQALTCGALTGAVMVLGLAGNRGDESQARQMSFAAVRELFRLFTARHGTTVCSELMGADMSTPEGKMRIQAEGLAALKCTAFIRDTAEILETLLEEFSRIPAQKPGHQSLGGGEDVPRY